MSKYDFAGVTEEVSGFGGSYEAACRQMVIQGCEWFDAHPGADPTFEETVGIIGLLSCENQDARDLTQAMKAGLEHSPTGVMMQAAVHHVLYIRRLGWEGYIAEMNARAAARPRSG